MPQSGESRCLPCPITHSESLVSLLYSSPIHTSDLKASTIASLAAGFTLSASGPLLSYDQTETRLLVTLCVAAWTRHGPTTGSMSDLNQGHRMEAHHEKWV